MGMIMRVMRLIQGMSWMMAASSISPEICIMLFSALRLDVSTIPPDMSDSYNWADEIYRIKTK